MVTVQHFGMFLDNNITQLIATVLIRPVKHKLLSNVPNRPALPSADGTLLGLPGTSSSFVLYCALGHTVNTVWDTRPRCSSDRRWIVGNSPWPTYDALFEDIGVVLEDGFTTRSALEGWDAPKALFPQTKGYLFCPGRELHVFNDDRLKYTSNTLPQQRARQVYLQASSTHDFCPGSRL